LRARAYDAAGNVSPVSGVLVTVSDPPGNGDTYASPSGVDAGNSVCSQANPCRSIAQAAALAPANKTVWLMNGDYTGVTQPGPIAIPAGLTLRALTPGLAGIGQQVVLQGSATVVGVVIRRNGFGDFGSIAASAGNVTLDGVKAVGYSANGSGFPAVLALSGSVHATMTPGGIADYADLLAPAGQNVSIFATLAGNAWFTVNGGTFAGAKLGGADGVSGAFNRGAFNLAGSSKLELNNVVLDVDSSGIFMFGDATQVALNNTQLRAGVNTGTGYGIYAAKGTPQVTLVDSSITGFENTYSRGSVGLYVGAFSHPGAAATLTTSNSTIGGADVGVFVTELAASPSSLTWTGTDTTVSGNLFGGVVCRDACSVDLTGGAISGNGTQIAMFASGGPVFHGGLWMAMAAKNYFLRLRNVQVVDNRSVSGPNTDTAFNSGVTIGGSASSGFDLGSLGTPGNNVFAGNTTGAQTSGLNVGVAPGVTVRAVGNTWIANTQGADAAGHYVLGSGPCGASSCNLGGTSSPGPNFRVTSGTLRLAE
ncbi:MAG: hypothetical protein ABW220_11695, partial [Burkholderiaceae bacterium]